MLKKTIWFPFLAGVQLSLGRRPATLKDSRALSMFFRVVDNFFSFGTRSLRIEENTYKFIIK